VFRALAVLLGVALTAPLAAEAQQADRIVRLGYLVMNRMSMSPPQQHAAFMQGLRDLGYVEGRNLVIEYREAEGKPERLPALAAELVALKPDVIVAPTTPAALAAKHATASIPVLFYGSADPVTSGLVSSLARPGGNVTGFTGVAPELIGKSIELLTQAVPGVTRIALLWQPGAAGERTERDTLKHAETAAQALGVRLHIVEARRAGDIERAFSDMTRSGARALSVWTSAMLIHERSRLVALAAKHRLPAVYTLREAVDAGGLMSYGHSQQDLNRRAAGYVDKILKGAKPADLPVEQPTKFDLVVNLKTARALGLTIPPLVLGRADQIIE
jgi:ABC-type uncharacterized transport system substrate-binding protein